MLKNKWITVCLFLGCFLIVSILSSIPIYTSGILGKLLLRDIQAVQEDTGKYPGIYSISTKLKANKKEPESRWNQYQTVSARNETYFASGAVSTLKQLEKVNTISTAEFFVCREGGDISDSKQILSKKLTMVGSTDFFDKVRLKTGELPSSEMKDGYCEALVSSQVAYAHNLSVGSAYELQMNDRFYPDDPPALKVRITGVYEPEDTSDVYWYDGLKPYENAIIMDYDTLLNDIIGQHHVLIKTSSDCLLYDYQQIETGAAAALYDEFSYQKSVLKEDSSSSIPALNALRDYSQRESQLTTIIVLLIIPLLFILVLYIYMIAKLIVGYDENEISVLKSRGATKRQIFLIYLYECLVIAVLALILGIPFGAFLSNAIGYSNGFLEFVNRSRLSIDYTPDMLLYPLFGVLLFVIATFIPVIAASRKNVLTHKQTQGIETRMPLWEKSCLDLIMIGVSLYGLYLFRDKENAVAQGAADMSSRGNPLIFIMSSLFILGLALLALRLYPWLVRLIHLIGKKRWPASIHVLMVNLSRNKTMGKLIILFLTFTISVGIFSAATARTVTQNSKDKIYYHTGADAVMTTYWKPSGYVFNPDPHAEKVAIYAQAPPFNYDKIDGVEAAARVYSCEPRATTTFTSSGSYANCQFMAVVPDEFSKVVWSRDDLLDYDISQYLNLLAKYPSTCIISRSLAEELKVGVNDTVSFNFRKYSYQTSDSYGLQVAAIVDYFPTYDKTEEGGNHHLLLANFDYIFSKTPMDWYDVWLKLDPDVPMEQFYNSLKENDITLVKFKNARDSVITDVNNDPIVQGINGTLSLAFIISLIATCIGFLIYWIVSIKNRALQFSVLRSMGISKKSLYVMIAFEQLLISCFSVLAGTLIGGAASSLFIPSIGLYLDMASQIPPFRMLILARDYWNIYIVVAALILLCIGVVISIVRKLNVTATLKLGEE